MHESPPNASPIFGNPVSQTTPIPTTTTQSAALYFREGNSDKKYHSAIEPRGGGFIVTFAYARRGSTLTTGTKTTTHVSLAEATRVFDKLVASKVAKGYRPTGSPAPVYQQSETEVADTGINRRGLETSVPGPVRDTVARAGHDLLIDGEAVGDTLHAFDLLEIDGTDLRSTDYLDRYHTRRHLRTRDGQTVLYARPGPDLHDLQSFGFCHDTHIVGLEHSHASGVPELEDELFQRLALGDECRGMGMPECVVGPVRQIVGRNLGFHQIRPDLPARQPAHGLFLFAPRAA